MAHTTYEAEEGLHDFETLLEKPNLNPSNLTPTQPKTAYSDIFRSSLWSSLRNKNKQPLNPTAYLDGLRGFAALLVYSLHHQVWGHSGVGGEFILENAFGWDKKYYFVCFPGIRIFFSGGHIAVAIFFIISGYVLSMKSLKLIQSGEKVKLADNLGSALFRRWLRLYIPVAATTFVWMTSWHVLKIKSGNPIAAPPERTYADELWKWYCDFKNFSFVFTGEPSNAYNDHAWSIPAEFRGSVVIYTALLAFARVKRNARLLCEFGLIYYFLYIVDGWFCALFMTGLLLCDLDLLAEKNQLPEIFYRLKPLQSWIYYVLILISLYLGGVPSITDDLDHLRRSPGWYLLSFLKPQAFWDVRWFFRYCAATCAMIAIPRIPSFKAFFETPFCQYLGRVSFGFYLVHGPVLWTLGDRLYAATGRFREGHVELVPGWINIFPFPRWGPFGLELDYLIPHLILLPFTLWLAEVVTKLFDEQSVKFSQWLFNTMVDPSEVPEKNVRWAPGAEADSLYRLK